jgi:PAS domain S-box-containing protein
MFDPYRQSPMSADALHEQTELLRVTLSSIGDAVITTDTKCNVTFLNPVAQSLTGWTQDEAAGVSLDTIFKIVNDESHQPVENPATRALREGLVVGLANHTLLIAKDGTELPIDDSAAPIRNRQGEICGVVLIFRDISQRRKAERTVQKALDFAENIIATLREPFLVVLDRDLKVMRASHSFYQSFQVSPEQTENRYIYDLGNRQWDIPKLRTLLEDILPNRNVFHDFEVEHEFPAIGRRIMLLNGRRVQGPIDSQEMILLAIEDITGRKRLETEVQERELRYRRLFEAARDGILILDAETGRITECNPFMSEILGYSRDELLGKELWQIGLFKDIASSHAAFRELQEKGEIRYHHLPLQTKNGQKVEVEFVSNVYGVDHHRVIQCNIRDITARTQLERMKVQAEASADLHRRKNEFLAMLSHELRNPLAPIMNAAQLLGLEHEKETPTQQQARNIIERQVANLKVIVDDLLEVSRITTGRINLHKDVLDFRGVVEGAVDSVQGLFDQRRHQLDVSLPAEPIWLYADHTRLEQVVVNLLTNAAKYTEEEGRVWLGLEKQGDEAVLTVRDTGLGIAPALLPRVFDLFTQAERTLDRSQGGLGIGLTVVQTLVEMHQGKVEVYSALGRGSEFVVRLPLHRTEERSQPPPAEKQSVSSLRILVVDDNVDAAESLAMLLLHAGNEVRTAHSGLTALETALEFRPNVVLLDIGLPEMDGYEVAKRLRQNPELKTVRLVALTGYGQETDRNRSQEAGFDKHVVKPIDAKELQELLIIKLNDPN